MRATRIVEKKGAGHFIASDRCRFTQHHHVGRYCISTVGDYCPRPGERSPMGYMWTGDAMAPAWYETMVFDLRAKTARWRELLAVRTLTEDDARQTHAKVCADYLIVAAREENARRARARGGAVVVPPNGKVGVAERRSRGRRA